MASRYSKLQEDQDDLESRDDEGSYVDETSQRRLSGDHWLSQTSDSHGRCVSDRECHRACKAARRGLRYVFRRANYQALVVRVSQAMQTYWSMPAGTHLCASAAESDSDAVCASAGYPSDGLADQPMHHALFVSPEEVIHKCSDGIVRCEDMESFADRHSDWYVLRKASSVQHADEVVSRARCRANKTEQYCLTNANSAQFVNDCYGYSVGDEDVSVPVVLGGVLGGGVGGAVATPLATTTVAGTTMVIPTYTFGHAGTTTAVTLATTTVSGPIVAAGIVAGVGLGAILALPAWYSLREAEQKSVTRVPLAIANPSLQSVYVCAYGEAEQWYQGLIKGWCGKSEGELPSGGMLELNPPDDAKAFTVKVFRTAPEDRTAGELFEATVSRGDVYRLLRMPCEHSATDCPTGVSESSFRLKRYSRHVIPAYGGASCRVQDVERRSHTDQFDEHLDSEDDAQPARGTRRRGLKKVNQMLEELQREKERLQKEKREKKGHCKLGRSRLVDSA